MFCEANGFVELVLKLHALRKPQIESSETEEHYQQVCMLYRHHSPVVVTIQVCSLVWLPCFIGLYLEACSSDHNEAKAKLQCGYTRIITF